MKIVKEFEDPECLAKIYHWCSAQELSQEHFYWGLGDDGELYLSCTRFVDQNNWHKLSSIDMRDHFSLKTMKRIVKEFGHLVVFT